MALELSLSRPFEFTRREEEEEAHKLDGMRREQGDLIAEGFGRRERESDDRIVSHQMMLLLFLVAIVVFLVFVVVTLVVIFDLERVGVLRTLFLLSFLSFSSSSLSLFSYVFFSLYTGFIRK